MLNAREREFFTEWLITYGTAPAMWYLNEPLRLSIYNKLSHALYYYENLGYLERCGQSMSLYALTLKTVKELQNDT